MSEIEAVEPDESFLAGESEMAARMRAKDWSATPLGPVTTWPQSLRTAVSICLNSKFPMVIWWGAELTLIYNDGWRPILGANKDARALGTPGREIWGEVWDVIGPMFETVMTTGQATWSDDGLLLANRYGYVEEAYFTWSYSPIRDESGAVGGVFTAVTETTERVLGERRLKTLRDLAAVGVEGRSTGEVCRSIAACLATNPADIPFAALYLADGDTGQVRLASTAGIRPGAPLTPAVLTLDAPGDDAWPVGRAAAGTVVVDALERNAGLPTGAWPDPPRSALVMPIALPGHSEPAAFLVAAVSPRRALDAAYRFFFERVAAQIGRTLADARAYEEERRRAEALAELDRAKTTFFSNISHEFRTPLTLMLGPLEDVLHDGDTSHAARQRLELVHRNGLRLLKLVNTLLDFSRIEAGRIDAVYEPTDLGTLTADLVSVFRAGIEKAGLRLHVECARLEEPVHVDRDMWEKIVLNLVSNAFKYTFAGEIAVTLRPVGDRVELAVRDTGTGIPAAELPHVFERFHRVRGAVGRSHEGTGIGLALVQELVKLHRGTIAVTSEPGVGTTFTVTVPRGTAHLPAERVSAERPSTSAPTRTASYLEETMRWLPADVIAEASPPSAVALSTRGARVVLADDNADMREYLQRLLSQHWEVDAVPDGRAALEAARARRPDLVLSDVMMPVLDGLEVLRALRADPATADIPVILLSARAGEESRVAGLEAGADDYLVKPFSARELIARVHAHLELHRVRREAMAREQAARAQAEEANRAKDEFLATLSHELRTPLNAILGWSVMLQEGPADLTARRRALEVIERNARAQAQLIEDLLDVSRIITGKMRLNVRAVDLIAVVQAALDAVRPAATAKAIRVQPVLDPTAGPVAGDPDRLQQVFWNLLSNAIKFTPKGGRVQIRLERVNSHIEVVVSDTGCGIPPEVLPYVFDRFRQADSTSSRRHGGLGLGLALVKHLVELHGGSARADSPGPDRGATFVVALPLMAQLVPDAGRRAHPLARRPTVSLEPSVLADLRLLVVDDEAETLELFSSLFSRHGAEVTAATGAAEALERLATGRFDVLVCDIEMPGEDGFSLIRKVRARGAHAGGAIPAVAVTAYGSVDDRIRLLAAGFQMHVPKPAEPDELVAVVASLAGRSGATTR